MRESVAAILTYGNEVFIIKRQNFLRAFPGYLSFVGGKIDDEDHRAEFEVNHSTDIEKYILNALFRELDEELNIDISELLEAIDKIIYLGDYETPDFNPHRFQTHYIQLELKEKLPIKATEDEAKFSSWVHKKDVINWYFKGNILIVPPVLNTISRLAEMEPYFEHDTPSDGVEFIHGMKVFLPKTNTLPPAERTNVLYMVEAQFIVDPASKDDDEFQKYLQEYRALDLEFIFLTHHHIDHVQNTNVLARELAIPMKMSQDTFERCQRVYDPKFFEGIEVITVREGDILGKWKNKDLQVIEVPGHDEGQLAFYPESKEWIMVSDLFQGLGTVVIGTDEGDMAKYFATLEKVIAKDFAAIIPSHGIPLGGVDHLVKVLAHRKMREKQVSECLQKKMSEDEILAFVYEGTPEKLLKYARLNIRSHIKKLTQ